MQKYTIHTHTIGFDGRNSVQEMVSRAKDMGFHTIGISNHFIVHPLIKEAKMYQFADRGGYRNIYSSSFDEALDKFKKHYAELDMVKEQNQNIQILRGMEVDFFDTLKWRKGFENALEVLKPDYVIGSTHFIKYSGMLTNSHDWAHADAATQDILMQMYWENLAKAAESNLFTWMAHLNLPKKVFLGLEDKWAEYENRAIESIAKTHTAVEINTSGYKPYCDEPYPSLRILKMVKQNDVPVLISDDAHEIGNIGRHFDKAEKLIEEFRLKRYTR